MSKPATIYGETGLAVFSKLVKQCENVGCFIDIGCGRGKLVFYQSMVKDIPALGLDIEATYIASANHLKTYFNVTQATFIKQDIANLDLMDLLFDYFKTANTDNMLVFISHTCFGEALSKDIEKMLLTLPKGTYVMTTSYHLSVKGVNYITMTKGLFSWGIGHLYLHQIC